mgnify:CR=1 FL=1
MPVYNALHITAVSNFMLAASWFGDEAAQDAVVWMIRPFLPEVTRDDWDDLRFKVVAKYMNYEPENFKPEVLEGLLESNPISAKLLDLCPPEFAAYH